MRIIFMGTPEFAVASLAALIHAGEDIVAVITAPDKPAGRGRHLQQSAVKQYADANGIPVLQPEKLRDPDFLAHLKLLDADLQVVVAFRMLPEVVWNMPPAGTVNLHASLLPQYRGAAPINHALINGETESGVSTFLLQHEIDTGNILFSEKVNIGPDDTAGDLHDRLMVVGADLLVKTVRAIAQGKIEPIPQDRAAAGTELKHAPKIFKEDCLITWNKPIAVVYNLIRGLSPYPTAYTLLDGKTLKLFKAEKDEMPTQHEPGTPYTDGKSFLKFACQDGYITVKELQLEGKKRMDVKEFLRGFRF
ncbi:methionyl-tRNA formyltransferase [Parapedobacter pyrenivorans]|uniref:Methionyl-tRNA formyltransferase n=1 Tax=Parapedobacter pyrenivorans TaxID=1305674 RepID=A0A917HY41_9SPHI|nr:methionyl-tRNA formyltransferase [Parapedobacter pyrenivorans]GGG97490.1 methionyl-tRNA formyltransferase [Parapedobacter pyrenivorans]